METWDKGSFTYLFPEKGGKKSSVELKHKAES